MSYDEILKIAEKFEKSAKNINKDKYVLSKVADKFVTKIKENK